MRLLMKRLTNLINGQMPDDQLKLRMGRSRLQIMTIIDLSYILWISWTKINTIQYTEEESLRMMDERLLTFSQATPRYSTW
jgi:hypothetical protein